MKLSDLKRLPIGTRLYLLECLTGPVPKDKQGRTIVKVRSADLIVEADHKHGSRSHLAFPPAKEFEATENGFIIYDPGYDRTGFDADGKPLPPEPRRIAARYQFNPEEESQ